MKRKPADRRKRKSIWAASSSRFHAVTKLCQL
jgi:hypothetical protein